MGGQWAHRLLSSPARAWTLSRPFPFPLSFFGLGLRFLYNGRLEVLNHRPSLHSSPSDSCVARALHTYAFIGPSLYLLQPPPTRSLRSSATQVPANMAPIALEPENHTRDAEFNKAMHGRSAASKGGVASMLSKNHAAHKAAIDDYWKHWDNKDAVTETDEVREVESVLPTDRLTST